MTHAYLTEKQVTHEFWFFAIKHAAFMLNQTPGWLGCQLSSPFKLIHGVQPDSSTWFGLFSIGYFDQEVENNAVNSKASTITEDYAYYPFR